MGDSLFSMFFRWEKRFPSRLLRAALPFLAGTPRNAPFHHPPRASPSFPGLRALPLGFPPPAKDRLAPPSLDWRCRLVTVASLDRHPPPASVSISSTWHRPQGVTVPATTLRPHPSSEDGTRRSTFVSLKPGFRLRSTGFKVERFPPLRRRI